MGNNGELFIVEEEDRELFNALPSNLQVKFNSAEEILENLIHWILPE